MSEVARTVVVFDWGFVSFGPPLSMREEGHSLCIYHFLFALSQPIPPIHSLNSLFINTSFRTAVMTTQLFFLEEALRNSLVASFLVISISPFEEDMHIERLPAHKVAVFIASLFSDHAVRSILKQDKTPWLVNSTPAAFPPFIYTSAGLGRRYRYLLG